ncbi:nuclear protein MDM1 isoform X2 [Spea bombifrons]|uniref:nuclear protein MDM1 isoform X2 n=1 Tax=Spea bombifrons TaxID=233779 RepID=UPI00234AD9CC|nr:nuclear protein MDM1 isoform X2 [Spea bombifrons]
MPVRFKGLSEYDRNFKWKVPEVSNQDPTLLSRWAGLRSDELGITKEPCFTAKRRVPYYNSQISKSFQWKEAEAENDGKCANKIGLHIDADEDLKGEEEMHTPDAPRLIKRPSSTSVPSKELSTNNNVKGKELQVSLAEDNKNMSKASPKTEARGFHRVLQRKAGLNIVPSQPSLKMSEYRRQFDTKSPVENSPILAAEQVIYNKNSTIPPFKVKAARTQTEYNSQYKGLPPAKGPKLRKSWEEKYVPEYEPEHHAPKRKDKKKKTNDAISNSAKLEKTESEQNQVVQRQILKQRLVEKLNLPSKGYRKAKTEYSANFLSPSEYKYKDGAWVRAQKEMLDQVRELHNKAEYYKHRSQGTHFSREHLNQILSASNRLWDVSSNSSSEEHFSSNIKALDLAGLKTSSKNAKLNDSPIKLKPASNTGNAEISDASTLPVRRRLVWDQDQDTDPIQEAATLEVAEKPPGTKEVQYFEENKDEDPQPIEERAAERDEITKTNPSEDGSEAASVSSEVGGRLPTPKLRSFGVVQRTHHDLTTPASGGALLVSPTKPFIHTPDKKKKGDSNEHYSSIKSISKEHLKSLPNKNGALSASSPPAAGIKTVDPIPLRKEQWPEIEKPLTPVFSYPMERSPVQRPFVSLPQQRNPSCCIHGALRDPEFQHNGDFGKPNYYKIPVSDDCEIEDDRLSQISARSAASSSLASQVLERAQKRKEHFWGKK